MSHQDSQRSRQPSVHLSGEQIFGGFGTLQERDTKPLTNQQTKEHQTHVQITKYSYTSFFCLFKKTTFTRRCWLILTKQPFDLYSGFKRCVVLCELHSAGYFCILRPDLTES